MLRLFAAMMTLAVSHRRLPNNPCEPVESPEEKVAEMLFISEAQVADLAETLGAIHAPWRALVLLGHSAIRMTLDRYGHLFAGHDDKMVETVSNPFTDRPARHLRAA